MISQAKVRPWHLPDIFLHSTFIANTTTDPGQRNFDSAEATGWSVWGSNPSRDKRFVPFPNHSKGFGGQHIPPIQSVPVSFLALRRPECNDAHSPQSNVKVKNAWSNNPTSSACFHGVSRDKFVFNCTVPDADTFLTWLQVKVKVVL